MFESRHLISENANVKQLSERQPGEEAASYETAHKRIGRADARQLLRRARGCLGPWVQSERQTSRSSVWSPPFERNMTPTISHLLFDFLIERYFAQESPSTGSSDAVVD